MSTEAYFVNITPKGAQKFLDEEPEGQPKRALNLVHVAWLARQMTEKRWRVNGESIIIGSNDAILDGRHRLHAVISSGVTIRALLIRGVDPDVFHTIDTGRARKVADVLTIAGMKHASTQGAVARMLKRMADSPDEIFTCRDVKNGERITGVEVIEVLQRHPGVNQVAHETVRFGPLGRPSILVLLRYLTMMIDSTKSERFFDALVSGEDLKRGQPVYALRERLKNARAMPNMRITETGFAAIAIKAWNAYFHGRRLTSLVYRASDPFPKIAGLTKGIIGGQPPE